MIRLLTGWVVLIGSNVLFYALIYQAGRSVGAWVWGFQ